MPFKCVEDFEEFIANLSYEELWETFDGYGELEGDKSVWDAGRSRNDPDYSTAMLRDLIDYYYIRDNPLPYRFDLECQENYGITSEEFMRRMDEDPFFLAPLYEAEHQRLIAENPGKNPYWLGQDKLESRIDFNLASIPMDILLARYEAIEGKPKWGEES